MNPMPLPMSFPASPMWGCASPFSHGDAPPWRHFENPHYHGFCHHCCHPKASCCCSRPHCRKEAKELVAAPGQTQAGKTLGTVETLDQHALLTRMMRPAARAEVGTDAAAKAKTAEVIKLDKGNMGSAAAFIGGGCCVHLSVEHMLVDPMAQTQGAVEVLVMDSHQTAMAWAKAILSGSHYEIHEDIITTYAGAELWLVVVNAVARVRWCEVFSG